MRVGDVVPLQTSEAELSGMATVLAVDSDFELAVGEGNPVTARYRTSEVDLIARVTLDSGDVVSGTTKHTIWSVSRRSFVEMAELQVGELVDTELGVASVQRVEVINEPQAVYNLEIAGQHVFRIGKTGVLVHNADRSYEQAIVGSDRTRVANLIRKARRQRDVNNDVGVDRLILQLERAGIRVKDTSHCVGNPSREVDIETVSGIVVQVKNLSSAQKIIKQVRDT